MASLSDVVLKAGEVYPKGLRDVDWDGYLDIVALNPSTIAHGRKSMLHLKQAWDAGYKDTLAMQWGRAVHTLLLEPALFEAKYPAWEGRRAGKKYEEFAENARLDGADVVMKANGEFSRPSAILAAQQFLKNRRVAELISSGEAEKTVLALEGDIKCRGRMDWISASCGTLVDIKTTNDLATFGRVFFRLAYDMKLGLYQRWLQRVTSRDWPVEVIVLESKPPYDAVCMAIPESVLSQGVTKALRIIREVRACIQSGKWPGVGGDDGCGFLEVPAWEMGDDELEGGEEVYYEE